MRDEAGWSSLEIFEVFIVSGDALYEWGFVDVAVVGVVAIAIVWWYLSLGLMNY